MLRPSHSITIIVLSSTNRKDPVNGRWVNETGTLLERLWQGEKKYCERKLSHCHFIHHNRHAVLQCSLVTMIRGSESTMHVKNTPTLVWWTSSPADPSSSQRTLAVIPFGRERSLLCDSSWRTCCRCYLLTVGRFMRINTRLSSHRAALLHLSIYRLSLASQNIRRIKTPDVIRTWRSLRNATRGRTGHRLRLQTTVFRKVSLPPSSRGKWEKLNKLFQARYKQHVPIP